ncbi:hypothetical protein GTQ40_00025 [Flavobacteriaceae bacterium R38]|nr:hypothetical protein [Flavobacteriaceae bacterium R38]
MSFQTVSLDISMKRKHKIQITGGVALVFIIMLCSYLYTNVYNKPHTDVNKATTTLSVSSKNLLANFNTNEVSANSTYVEKVIIVEGKIKKITYLNDRYTILLHGQNELSNIICDMSMSQFEDIKKLNPGQTVNIKGICKGYLMDVIMLNCILVNKENK